MDGIVGGATGLLLGAMLIGRRDECVAALRMLVPLAPGWRPPIAGAITGTGLALMIASAWMLRDLLG